MKIIAIITVSIVAFIVLLFLFGYFYRWALDMGYSDNNFTFKRPVCAAFGVFLFVISVTSSFGACLSIPLDRLGKAQRIQAAGEAK